MTERQDVATRARSIAAALEEKTERTPLSSRANVASASDRNLLRKLSGGFANDVR